MGISLGKHLHGGHRGHRAGVGRKSRESGGSAGLLDVGVGETSGEGSGGGERLDAGQNVGAVNHVARVLTENSKLRHSCRERAHHVRLVVDVRLPEARSARVARELGVGLEAHLTGEGRLDLALVRAVSAREEGAAKLCLHEELSVEGEGRAVEGSAGDGRVDWETYQHRTIHAR